MRSILFPQAEEKPPVVGLNAEDAAEVQQERVTPKDERDSTTGEPDRLVGDSETSESASDAKPDSEFSVSEWRHVVTCRWGHSILPPRRVCW